MLITRNITKKTLTLGNPETILLPRNYCYRKLVLRLTGSVDITNGTVAFTQHAQGGARLLSNLRIRRDGKDTMYALSGALTYELNKLMYGKAGALTNPAVSNATDVAVAVTLVVPFENLLGIKPFDTLLNASGLSSLDLLVDTVSAGNVFNAGNGTVAVNDSFVLEVSSIEETGANQFAFGDLRQYLAQKVQVTGASASFQIKPISVGNYYKGFMIYAEDAGTGSDTLLNNIKLKSGVEVFVDRPAQAIKDEWLAKQNISSFTTGIYYIDLMSDGLLNQTLDVTPASGRQTLEFELDVNAPAGTAYVYIVPIEYTPSAVVTKK